MSDLFHYLDERHVPSWYVYPSHIYFKNGYSVPSDSGEKHSLFQCLSQMKSELEDERINLNYSLNKNDIRTILIHVHNHIKVINE